MFRNTLYGHYGLETLRLEFKEFCLKDSLNRYMSQDQAGYLLQYHQWDDMLLVPIKDTLSLYIHNILPKYISSFGNARIDGDFVIGVSDNGEITGIPFKGKLSTQFVKNMIRSSVQTMVRGYVHMDVDVIRLDCKEDIVYEEDENVDCLYNEYKKVAVKNLDIESKYNTARKKWLSELEIYSIKLETMINSRTMRDEILNFMMKSTRASKTVQEELKGTGYITIPPFDVLQTRKINPSDILYWLVEFRDNKKKEICQRRPTKPKFHRSYTPIQIVSKLSCMRSIFRKIDNLYYYIIVVHIHGAKTAGAVYYIDHRGKWSKKHRKIHDRDGSPYSD